MRLLRRLLITACFFIRKNINALIAGNAPSVMTTEITGTRFWLTLFAIVAISGVEAAIFQIPRIFDISDYVNSGAASIITLLRHAITTAKE